MSTLPPITVTNNTSGPIELLDSYQQPTGDQPVSATTPVTYTPLGTIPAGATQTIEILHASNHIVATQTGPLSDPTAGTQVAFPVKVIGVLSIGQPRAFTVEQADKAAMEQTYVFIRYVSANPGSTLASQFLAALDSKDQTSAVNAFFAGSKSFSACSMTTWTAVTAWQTDFLSSWQGSYYLYDASDDLKAMKLVAGVNVTVSGEDVSAELWLADADGQWSSASAHTPLSIASGVLNESTPTPGLSASLKPVWANAVQTTASGGSGGSGGAGATTVIAPTLAGTVNGTKVLGNFRQMPTPASSSSSSSPTGAVAAWLKKNVNISVLISAGMLYMMYKQWQESKNTKADQKVSEDQAAGADDATIESDVQTVYETVEVRIYVEMSPTVEQELPSFEDFPEAEQAAQELQAQADVQEVVAQQEDALESVLEEAPASPATDDVVTALQNASDKADAGDVDGAWSDLGEVSTNLETLVSENEGTFSQEAQDAAKAVQDDIAEANEQADAEAKAQQEQQEEADKGADDPVDGDDVNGPDSDPIEFPGGE